MSTKKIPFFILLLLSLYVSGQFPYNESFQNNTASGMVVAGSAQLTAATGVDPNGQGYLRLTDNSTTNVGYAYCQQAFPSNYGLTASFEFYIWKSDAAGWNQADGISVFLFDASVNSFRPGGTGGSLGYAQYYSVPGMAKGYMGISIDGFGNFSSATDGNKNGGPGQQRGSIAIRGPGNGGGATDYVYQTGVVASNAPYNAGFLNFTQRYPLSTSANYRKIQIIMTPGSSAGSSVGYTITVKMIKGGSPTTTVTLINNYDYPFTAPSQLKFGMAASTGAIGNYQEIRNLNIDVTNTGSLLTPVLSPDAAMVCQGQSAILDICANDVSANLGGSINKATVDLDPLTAGRQTSYTDAGKGTYAVDANGIVTFTPILGYSGISSINYKVDDTYGITSLTSSAITVTVNALSAPNLTIVDPAAVCSPATVNITSPAFKTLTTSGASYDYFATLTDANNNTSNINSSATAISQWGTYYIRANLMGCATVKPIVVQINQSPTAANAGIDQNYCNSTGGQNITLLANNPSVGIGTWSQVSGPSTKAVNFSNAATTPVVNLDKGVYVYRWTVANGACATSLDDIQISVGIAANAGSPQTICNATSASLQGNIASPGTGLWTKVSGPFITFTNSTLGNTDVTGLVPGNSYTMQWKITNGACISTNNVTITNVLNTLANAGIDQSLNCSFGSLSGNTVDIGNTGNWTLVSGPTGNNASIIQPGNPLSAISGLNKMGDYIFRWTITNGTFSNFDDVKISVLSVLPVKLVYFKGTEQNGTVMLNWQTANEQSNDRFDVERSVDGVTYEVIGTKRGSGYSSVPTSYAFTDDIALDNSGVFYYRLRQIDMNGKFMLSGVVRIKVNTQPNITLYPNPFVNNITLNINADEISKATITLFTANGQIYSRQIAMLVKGNNIINMNGLQHLLTGAVTLQIIINNETINYNLIKK